MKRKKNYKKGPVPIYLRITVDGKRAEPATGRNCDPERWNRKPGRAAGTKEDIKSLYAFLGNYQLRVYDTHRLLCEKKESIIAEPFKKKLIGKDENTHMLIEIFKDHNLKMAALAGREFYKETLDRYETSLRHTQEFSNYYLGLLDIDIKQIDNALISEYDFI